MMSQLIVLLLLLYLVSLFGISRRRRAAPLPAPGGLFFVFVIPCLNEEEVIGPTLESLLALPGDDYAVLVVDDGSDDATPEVVQSFESERVALFRRELPAARQGKGAVLNAAFHHLAQSPLLEGRSPDDVVVAVFDADGRIDREALSQVAGYFRDPRSGAVQIRVDMRNADTNLLACLQDIEFAVFTEIYQRARQRIGSVGLGGNGQFVRLQALRSLGGDPWSDCLTEDLELGVRLLIAGWKNHYCPTASVSQQAVTTIRRWLRQRSRWFQGHLQCWRMIPRVLRSRLAAKSASDVVWYLLMPVWVLLVPLAGLPVMIGLVGLALTAPGTLLAILGSDHGLLPVMLYLLVFGPSYLCAFAYWLRGRIGFGRAIVLAHAYELYSNLWLIAGWMAVFRIVFRKRGWAKTARVAETEPAIEAAK